MTSCAKDRPAAEPPVGPSGNLPDATSVVSGPLVGRVTFSGVPKSSHFEAHRAGPCAKAASTQGSPVSSSGLADVVVWLEGAPAPDSAPKSVELTALECSFEPRVSTAQQGALLLADNKDVRLHSFHLRRDDRQGGRSNLQNLVVPSGEPPASWPLNEPGLVHINSDAIESMEAWVFVHERGLSTVTDSEGGFELSGVPAGNWTVRFLHPHYGETVRPVLIPADGPASLYVSLPSP
jgi:hypothetical protein